ncbi:MAG: right-handed parallel beta-helix repeat-containing protein [Bacteroidales bacterium]|nr:right-handed parallel beta-helix repeat-containing protein [Bacteroidales bacterium]
MKRFLTAILIAAVSFSANAQFKSMAESLKNKATGKVQATVNKAKTDAHDQKVMNSTYGQKDIKTAKVGAGPVYYVSAETGSNRADGLTPQTAKKDIQKALDLIHDNGQDGATVRVAEGNYLGYLDAGYIEIRNWITLEGGWNADFTDRDPFTYITKMQPTQEQLGTNGNKALITLSGLDNTNYVVAGTLIIDGIMLDYGFETLYLPYDPSDERTGSPEGVDTGRMIDDGGKQVSHQAIHSEAAIAGNMIIRNCLVMNSPYFGIQVNTRCGEIEIYNCVIISNRFAGVRIDGWDKEGYRSKVNFHHNSVGFSWCREKYMEDMGYGYEFMSKVSSDLHHNIFFCNNYAAVSRTHALSGPDAPIEAKRVTDMHDNYFFMNAADLQLPSKGGGKWTNVMVRQFDDVDEKTIPNIDGNKNLSADDPFVKTLWAPYLNGFANLKVLDESSSFDRNSAANLYRQAHGMNMQGTETRRVSMFGNRYRFEEAMKIFGAKAGYGAQKE